MAHKQIYDFCLPGCVWKLIAHYAEVTEAQPHDAYTFLMVGRGERDRRAADQAGQLVEGKTVAWPVMESHFQPWHMSMPMMTRREFVYTYGPINEQIAQRASLFEAFRISADKHAQTFPMELFFHEEGEEPMVAIIDPELNIRELTNEFLAYQPSFRDGRHITVPSPFHYSHVVRAIADEQAVEEASEVVRGIITTKRVLMIHLKAYLFTLMINEWISPANAVLREDATLRIELAWTSKYVELFNAIVGGLFAVVAALLRAFCVVYNSLGLDWYYELPAATQAAVDVAFVCLVVIFTRKFDAWLKYQKPLKQDRCKGPNVYLGQLVTEKGLMHNVRVDGKNLRLPTLSEVNVVHQDEMAMPGSEYFPCKSQPIGAILVCTEDSDLRLFGVFWRMDDYLITARHCSNTLNQSTAKIYLASIRQTKKGNWEINRTSLFRTDEEFWSPERNVIASYDIDAFAVELTETQWAMIKIKTASTKVRSSYGQQIHSVGFTPDGLLVSASGKTLADSGFEYLHHTASTQKGFSGSIILCGNSVVGMHISAAGEHNVAVRTEMIQYLIDAGTGLEANTKNRKKYTYADASYKEHYRQNKWRGGVADIKQMRDGKFAVVLKDGEATYGWNMNELIDAFGTGNAARDEDMFEDMLASSSFARKYGSRGGHRDQYVDFDDHHYDRRYDNENASIASTSRKRSGKNGTKARKAPALPKKKDMEWLYEVKTGLKPIHGPSAPKLQPEALQVIENHKDEIVALGFEEGKFAYPAMTPAEERVSLEKHLEIFGAASKTITRPPREDEIERCANIVAEMMEANAFVPDEDYNELSGILNVIHSSIIGSEKSAGFPYCEQGTPTNGQVLSSFGEKGFAQLVLNEWDAEYQLRVFEKGEPTKEEKIREGRPRIIVNLPLHGTVKHASVFKNFSTALVKHWKSSPIKFAFSPANPGHLEHLKECLPGEVYESDKSTWDFTFHAWIAEVTKRVIQKLARRPMNWTDQQFEHYLSDIAGCFDQVFKNSKYRTSDGTLYTMKQDGIMKSGWFMTIGVNSIAQVVVDAMVQMRLGFDNESIVNKNPIVAGGDDVNQDLTGICLDDYKSHAQSLGVKTEIHVREDLEHSEFFSSDIRKGVDGLEFHPKRWTKHIEHLKTVKVENLADALCSHMENYRHNAEKFRLLENMYHALREARPDLFPVSKLRNRQFLIAKQYGYEHALF